MPLQVYRTLDHLIHHRLDPVRVLGSPRPAALMQESYWTIRHRLSDIQRLLADAALGRHRRRYKQQCFSFHQRHLVSYAFTLYTYRIAARGIQDISAPVADYFYGRVYADIEALLSGLRVTFYTWFDPHTVCLPVHYDTTRRRIMDALPAVRALLQPLPRSLTSCILSPLHRMVRTASATGAGAFTYAQVSYIRLLVRSLLKIRSRCRKTLHLLVIRTLVYINFNHHHFLAYLVRGISLHMYTLPLPAARIACLIRQRTRLLQVDTRVDAAYRPEFASVSLQLLGWLDGMLDLLRHRPGTERPADHPVAAPAAASSRKLHTTLSVGQLACWLRLSVETGLIRETNLSRTAGILADTVATGRTDTVSASSLRNKYYDPDPEAIRAVRGQLEAMLRVIDGL